MSIQYFATSFYNESPVNACKIQLCNPNGLYLIKNDSDSETHFEFLVEATHDHTLSANRIRIGSWYRKNYKINNNASLKIEEYNETVRDAQIVVINNEYKSDRAYREMQYIYVGLVVDNITVVDIISTNKNEPRYNEYYRITKETRFYVQTNDKLEYDLNKQEKKLEELLYAPLLHNNKFIEYKIDANVDFFVNSDQGMFPVKFVKKVCSNLHVNVIECSFSNLTDESNKIQSTYKKAYEMKPCAVIFTNLPSKKIDFDILKKYSQKNETSYGVISLFISNSEEQNKFINETYGKERIFDLELCDASERQHVIEKITKEMPMELNSTDIEEIVEETKGMSIYDITRVFEKLLKNKLYEQHNNDNTSIDCGYENSDLMNDNTNIKTKSIDFQDCNVSYMNMLYEKSKKNIYADIVYKEQKDKICESIENIKLEDKNIKITMCDVRKILKKSIITSQNENIEKSKYTFDDIGGYEDVKQILRESVIWPLKHKEIYKRFGLGIPKGIILYGPPGCAKTLLAKAISNESKMSFLNVKGSELESKWVGETTHNIHELFKKAKANSPCILFIDEIDAIVHKASDDDRMHYKKSIAAFLTAMDGLDEMKDVIVIGTTNRINVIDDAFLRPGRIDKCIFVGLPDANARKRIFEIKLKDKNVGEKLINSTDGLSGAEITQVCQDAAMRVVRRIVNGSKNDKITEDDLLEAVENIKNKKK